MTDRKTSPVPRLLQSGYATIYSIVPPGTFKDEFRHVSNVLNRTGQQPDRRSGIVSEYPEVSYLLGQARFAARVEATDYSTVLERSYPDRLSKALVSNAVFSVPYEWNAKPAPAVSRSGMIRFFTHLRARRDVYKVDPVRAESLIVECLHEICDDLGPDISVEAGLGWADFVVSGAFHPKKFDDFLAGLAKFHSARIDPAIGGNACAFARSLTLLGYVWTGAHQHPVFTKKLTTLMFIRAKPGRLSKVETLVKETFPRTIVEFVDGKIDIVALMTRQKCPDFFAQHERLSEVTGTESIEKLETHIIFGHDVVKETKPDEKQLEAEARADCGCATERHPEYHAGELPPPLAHAVKNIEFLCASTMNDSANCCDARTAVLACEHTLKRLLQDELTSNVEVIDAAEAQQPTRDQEQAAAWADARLVEKLARIERWVRTSERILRQRTVGSFEEFLGQSDRAVSYRGGAQKILTVADNLMNDFYARISRRKRPVPYLTSFYDSVDRIQHVVGSGQVRIPVRALFFLPAIVPDLWHEVGGFHFFRTVHASSLGLDLMDTGDEALYRELADCYGDLVSFLYGFKFDLEQFGTSLLEAWLASLHRKTPAVVRRDLYVHIIARIVAASEFLFEHTDPVAAAEDRKRTLIVLYEEACDIASRYNSPKIPTGPDPVIQQSVLEILETPKFYGGLKKLRMRLDPDDVAEAVRELENPPADERFDFKQPAALRGFTPDTDMNDEFRKLYWAVMQQRRATGYRPHAFAVTAALTRGAALEYHRRAANRMILD